MEEETISRARRAFSRAAPTEPAMDVVVSGFQASSKIMSCTPASAWGSTPMMAMIRRASTPCSCSGSCVIRSRWTSRIRATPSARSM